MLIGIAGFKGSGKNLVAEMLGDIVNTRSFGFAETIKEGVLAMFPESLVTRTDCYGPSALREKTLGDLKRNDGEPLTLRYVLQTLGTEWGRDTLYKNIWCDIGILKAKEFLASGFEIAAITDLRFINEAQAVKRNGGVIWYVDRPSVVPADENLHASEAEMLSYEFRSQIDVTLDNSGDLFQLRREVERAFDYSRRPGRKRVA